MHLNLSTFLTFCVEVSLLLVLTIYLTTVGGWKSPLASGIKKLRKSARVSHLAIGILFLGQSGFLHFYYRVVIFLVSRLADVAND